MDVTSLSSPYATPLANSSSQDRYENRPVSQMALKLFVPYLPSTSIQRGVLRTWCECRVQIGLSTFSSPVPKVPLIGLLAVQWPATQRPSRAPQSILGIRSLRTTRLFRMIFQLTCNPYSIKSLSSSKSWTCNEPKSLFFLRCPTTSHQPPNNSKVCHRSRV